MLKIIADALMLVVRRNTLTSSLGARPRAGTASSVGFWRNLRATGTHLRDRKRLAMLDDHMLADIGLTRADVAAILEKPLWTPQTSKREAEAERVLQRSWMTHAQMNR